LRFLIANLNRTAHQWNPIYL